MSFSLLIIVDAGKTTGLCVVCTIVESIEVQVLVVRGTFVVIAELWLLAMAVIVNVVEAEITTVVWEEVCKLVAVTGIVVAKVFVSTIVLAIGLTG